MSVKILIANYTPEFSDGRIKRMQALSTYLNSRKIECQIISFGMSERVSDREIKLKSNAIKYFHHQSSTKTITSRKNNPFGHFFKKLARRLLFPDLYIFDTLLNLKKIKNFVSKDDIVVISVPWFSVLLFAVLLNSNKIIFDLRDLYIGNHLFSKYPFLDKIFFKYMLKYSSVVWVTTASAKANLACITDCVVDVVPNGVSYEEVHCIHDNFALVNKKSKKIKLCYFGNLGGDREFKVIFKSLRDIPEIELIGAGNFDAEHIQIFGDSYLGFLDKQSLYQKMANVNIAIICIRMEEHAEFAIPAKIYEAMCAGIPILLISPKCAAAKVLLEQHSYPFLWMNHDHEINLDCLEKLAQSKPKKIVYQREVAFANALCSFFPSLSKDIT